MTAVAAQTYTAGEEAEVRRWVAQASELRARASDGDSDGDSSSAMLSALDAHLASRTTVLGTKPSAADVAVYEAVAPLVRSWTPAQRTGPDGRPHVVRHLDFVQNSALFAVDPSDKVAVDADDVLYVKPPVDAKAEKERLKKEKEKAKAAAAAATGETGEAKTEAKTEAKAKTDKADKKEKKTKQAATPARPPPSLSPGLIDLRVGHILKAVKHAEADSLYVSTIAMGDAAGTDDTAEYEGHVCRTVCSGLNGLVPLQDMQGRKVVVVCNLKPVKMRGVKSCAMVLAASPRPSDGDADGDADADHHKGPVELVSPPADASAGERVFFQGWDGVPEKVLNAKKKTWETLQPGFTTTDSLEVAFDAGAVKELGGERGKHGLARLVTQSGRVCTVASLKDAQVR